MNGPKVCCVDCAHMIGDRTAMTGDELCGASPFPQAKHPVTGRMMPYLSDSGFGYVGKPWQPWDYAYCKHVNYGDCELFKPHTGETEQ